jgi:hypothetical protein
MCYWPADDDRAFDKHGLGNDTNDGNVDDRGGRAKNHILSAEGQHCVAA